MLLKYVGESADDPDLRCYSCIAHGRAEYIVLFEYFLLLKRIRAWAADEQACTDVFSYHQEKMAERMAAEKDQ